MKTMGKWVLKTALIGIVFFNPNSFSQDNEKYSILIKDARHSYNTKKYQESANYYKLAFELLAGKVNPDDRYDAACSMALVGNIEDSFHHLFILANDFNFTNLGHITIDTDLTSLHKDKRWSELIATIEANKERSEENLDKPLVNELDVIYQGDQKYRLQLAEIEKIHGRGSEAVKAHWKIIHEKDAMNLGKVKKILDERGWVGEDIIGTQGSITLFLVIQHSDLETQQQYLPMLREAVGKGNAKASSLALLEDRIAIRQGKRQIYGSQIGIDPETGEPYVSPLVDPENVDKRRKEVGLEPLAGYIAHWNMTWDIEKHKERTVRLESEKE